MEKDNKKNIIKISIIAGIIVLIILLFIFLTPIVKNYVKQKSFDKEILMIEEASLKITTNEQYKNMAVGNVLSVSLKELLDKKYIKETNNPYTNKPFDAGLNIYITKKDKDEYTARFEYRDNCKYNGSSCLSDVVKSDLKGKSIKYQKGTYYHGTNDEISNNYVWFNGFEYRIMGVNSDGSIKMITSLPLVSISWGGEGIVDYSNSYARKWLNILPDDNKLKDEYEGVFYTSLKRPDLIKEYPFCIGKQDPTNETDTTCDVLLNDKVGLLTWWEYVHAGPNKDGTSSYLDIKDRLMFLTGDKREDNKLLLTDYTGSVFMAGDDEKHLSMSLNYGYAVSGLRPVINLIDTVSIASGDGTSTNPFRIVGDESGSQNDLLTSRYIGEYVNIDDDKYRIVSTDKDGNIKIVSDKRVKSTGTSKKDVYTYFDLGSSKENICNTDYPHENCNNKFDISDGSLDYDGGLGHNIGYFLNSEAAKNSFYNSLGEYKKYLTDTPYPLGKWSIGRDYKTVYEGDEVLLKVGMLHYGEMLAGNNLNSSTNTNNYWLITPFNNYEASFISVSGNASNEFPNADGVGVRPVLTLKNDIRITKGDGTLHNPYHISN